mgnify:CR=1 FL=1
MNIAGKFKKALKEKDIYKSDGVIKTINPKVERVNKFGDLAEKLISKIKNTPCWSDFTMNSQEKMISKYFDKKIKSEKYTNISYNQTDKLTFIEEVLKSVV